VPPIQFQYTNTPISKTHHPPTHTRDNEPPHACESPVPTLPPLSKLGVRQQPSPACRHRPRPYRLALVCPCAVCRQSARGVGSRVVMPVRHASLHRETCVVRCRVVSCRVASCRVVCFVPCHVVSCRVVSCHVVWCMCCPPVCVMVYVLSARLSDGVVCLTDGWCGMRCLRCAHVGRECGVHVVRCA
jgi:hypothetical protein